MYYNTTKEKGEKLKEYQDKALSQNERITRFFLKHKGKEFTPSEVLRRVFNMFVPITSVRRSITNLTKEGILKQTETKREGLYGRNENTWTWAR